MAKIRAKARYEVTTEFNGTKTADALYFGTKYQCEQYCLAKDGQRKRGHKWVLAKLNSEEGLKVDVNLNFKGSVHAFSGA
jgi:hypothetical protein